MVAVVVSSCLDSTPTLPVDHVRVSVGIGHRQLPALVCALARRRALVVKSFFFSSRAALIVVRGDAFVCLGQRDGSMLLRAQHKVDDNLGTLHNTQLLICLSKTDHNLHFTSPHLASPRLLDDLSRVARCRADEYLSPRTASHRCVRRG